MYVGTNNIPYADIPVRNDAVITLQKAGTIIPMQNVKRWGIDRISKLKDTPIYLSAVLGRGHDYAVGHVLIEDGNGVEFYEIKAAHNMMFFKQ
jgi:hypothetical protein